MVGRKQPAAEPRRPGWRQEPSLKATGGHWAAEGAGPGWALGNSGESQLEAHVFRQAGKCTGLLLHPLSPASKTIKDLSPEILGNVSLDRQIALMAQASHHWGLQ